MERKNHPSISRKSAINAHAQGRSFVMNIVSDEFFFENEADLRPIEQLLQKKEVKFLLQNVNGFICIYNYKKNIYEYMSENLRAELGYEPESFLGEKGAEYMLRMFDEYQLPSLMKITAEILQYLSINSTYETGRDFRHTSCMKFKNIYNEFIWFMVDKSMIQIDKNGFPIRALITCTNIHAFKKDETLHYSILKKDANGIYQSVWQGSLYEKKEEAELTNRELEIIKLIAEGFTNAQIAEKLFISLTTVQTHRKHILRKTQLKGTAELTKLAFARGMVYERGSNDGLYIGTEAGVFYTNRSMNSWIKLNNGLPNAMVRDLEINYTANKIRAATYGRGIWESHLVCPTNLDLTVSGGILTGEQFYEAENSVTASAYLGNGNFTFRAGQSVEFISGFTALAGEVTAYVHPCALPGGNTFRQGTATEDLASEETEEESKPITDAILSVYPNPNSGMFKVKLSTEDDSPKNIFIYDMLGNEAFSKRQTTDNEFNVDISSKAKGIYMIKVTTRDKFWVSKFVSQ